jgi:hypothetical protein
MLATAAVLWAPASGAAATLYASPSGAGSACTSAGPCSLPTAVSSANGGDTVIVQSGTYGFTSVISSTKGIAVTGTSPRPVIEFSYNGQLQLSGAGATLRDVEVDGSAFGGDAFAVTGGTVERVIGRSGGVMGAAGCGMYGDGSVIRDSLCVSSAGPGLGLSAVGGADRETARNVTAIGASEGVFVGAGFFGSGESVNATIVNTIARATGSGGIDIAAVGTGGGMAAASVSHSNYSSTSGSITDDGTSQTATPAFANASAGDYHEAPSSPTIDAGTDTGVFLVETDLDGNPRTVGSATDIGAYQYFAPVVSTLAVTAITTAGATLNGSIVRRGPSGSAQFEFGATSAYGLTVAAGPVPEGGGPVEVSATVSGLPPGTLFHYRVDYTVGSTTYYGNDLTFRTATVVPVLSSASESRRIFRAGNALASFSRTRKVPVGTIFSFTLNEQATVTFAFTYQTPGRELAHKCAAQTRHNRRNRACKRTLTAGTLSFTGHPGTNRVAFQGRISRTNKLKPGRYTLTITATNSAGQRSNPQTLTFKIVR